MSAPVSIGRIVHFVLPTGDPSPCRPAIVVHVFHDGGVAKAYGYPDDTPVVNLQVFTDGVNDASAEHAEYATGIAWETSCVHDPVSTRKGRTWHWPDECGSPVPK